MKIEKVLGREILDSRGLPTVECNLFLSGGVKVTASVPSGMSTGKYEALELRDNDLSWYQGKGVKTAVKNLETKIADLIIGREPNLIKMDKSIIDYDGTINKSNLGANAVLAASITIARAQALNEGKQLYSFLSSFCVNGKSSIPSCMFNLLNGGVHASNGICFQEFMVMPKIGNSFVVSLQKIAVIYQNLKKLLLKKGFSVGVGDEGGFAPLIKDSNLYPEEVALNLLMEAIEISGFSGDMVICLDVAASQFYDKFLGKYILYGKAFSAEDLVDFYEKLILKYSIFSIEDGMDEDDWNGWAILTSRLGSKIQIVGDDIFVTNCEKIKKGLALGVANTVLIKPNQIGTVSEAIETINYCKKINYKTVISHRSGETCDTFIADLVVAMEAKQFKCGAPVRGERVVKYNRLLELSFDLNCVNKL